MPCEVKHKYFTSTCLRKIGTIFENALYCSMSVRSPHGLAQREKSSGEGGLNLVNCPFRGNQSIEALKYSVTLCNVITVSNFLHIRIHLREMAVICKIIRACIKCVQIYQVHGKIVYKNKLKICLMISNKLISLPMQLLYDKYSTFTAKKLKLIAVYCLRILFFFKSVIQYVL